MMPPGVILRVCTEAVDRARELNCRRRVTRRSMGLVCYRQAEAEADARMRNFVRRLGCWWNSLIINESG